MIAELYTKISDQENDDVFVSRLKGSDGEALRAMLGPMYGFNPRNATGHYKLDLSDPWQNRIACKLVDLSSSEKKRQSQLDLKDLSQHGTQECWRNECYDGVPFKYSPLSFVIPSEGILELDYATFVRPPSKATPVPDQEYEAFRDALRVQLEPAPAMALVWLRKKSLRVYVSAVQMVELCNVFEDPAERCDAFVLLWPRLVDEENSQLMLQHFSTEENQHLRHRLGHLALFNPIAPEGKYELDLSFHEQSSVAKLLLLLSVREPGQNLENEIYDDKPITIPKEWLANLPSTGILKLEYHTESPENCLMDLRRSLAEQVLGWSFEDSPDDI